MMLWTHGLKNVSDNVGSIELFCAPHEDILSFPKVRDSNPWFGERACEKFGRSMTDVYMCDTVQSHSSCVLSICFIIDFISPSIFVAASCKGASENIL